MNMFMLPQTRTIRFENDSVIFLGSVTWNYLQIDIKAAAPFCSLDIKRWNGESCNWKICKN